MNVHIIAWLCSATVLVISIARGSFHHRGILYVEGKDGKLRKESELVTAGGETAMSARKVAERQAQAADAHLSADDMYEQGMAAAKRMAVASPAQPAPKEGAVTRTVVRQCKHSRHYHERAPLPVGASPGCQRSSCHEITTDMNNHALVLCLCIQPGRPTRYHLLDQYLFCPVASFKVRMFMPISEAGSMSSAGCHLLFSGIKISLSGHPKLTSHGQTSIARAAGHTGNVDWEAIYGTAKPADRCGADDTSSECAAVWPGQLYGAEPYPTGPSSSKGPPEPDAGVRTLEKSEFLPSSNLPNRLSYDGFIARFVDAIRVSNCPAPACVAVHNTY